MSAETDDWVIVAGGVEVNRLRGDASMPVAQPGQLIYKASELPIGIVPIQPSEYTQQYQGILSGGYLDATTGIRLKATVDDQTRYGLALLLSNEGISKGIISGETVQSIWDFNEVEHTMTTSNLKDLILRYGLWCRTMFNLYA